ncbi:molybdate ABC transporter substrate-binding protein [Halomonas binhaiensis]|uniref:Molybdate ABC transporter substrate-binding protein n=1 Tax=Halomonas binhaiensis TaxID=2562282 RepID=A0A5C1NKB7_9GAMM|nr:molybdate ABC transporter substrate-binding protein [Halomonas binhaiensis]QEM82817.1 molybdate ABC transporter substrate-binding protein [Halomonas binhaiensis]
MWITAVSQVRCSRICSILVGVLATGLSLLPVAGHAQGVSVAAASSLRFAMPELIQRFESQQGVEVRTTYGASGNFQRQIEQGAPFEVFLSADDERARALEDKGLTESEGKTYALGRLAWLQRDGQPLPPEDAPLEAVRQAVERYEADGVKARIALANPLHAPYGVAAQQVLEHADLWQRSRPLQVMGENVAQAAQFSLSAEAAGGLVAYSLVVASPEQDKQGYRLIPSDWHSPLVQRMVLVKGASEDARAFFEFMSSPEAAELLSRYGFSTPNPSEE